MSFYKSKYKLVKKTNQKTLFYKNSRLWKFNDKRGYKFIRKGFWHRRYLKLKSLSWLVKRRFLRLNKKFRERKNLKYRNYLNSQKSFLQFYGKFKFKDFKRNFFINYKNKRLNKLNFFIKSFELRPSTILYRLKFFPTIFSSTFFIRSKGFKLNGNLTKNVNQLVKIGDVISLNNNYWFLFLYIFERKLYKRITRFISSFSRKKKFFKKYNLYYYLINKNFLKNKKKQKFLYKFKQNDLNFQALKFKNNNTIYTQKSYLKNLNKLYLNSNKLSNRIKIKKTSLNKKYSFLNNKRDIKFKSNKYTQFKNLNLKLKFNNLLFIYYKNIKIKLLNLKLILKLLKLKKILNYMYKFIKLFKNKNLNFFWFFIYLQYTKLKFLLINKTSKKLNNINTKFIFINFIKTKFLKTINIKLSSKKFINLINKKKVLFMLINLFKNLSTTKILAKTNSTKKFYSLINFIFINKLFIYKSNNIKYLKNYKNNLKNNLSRNSKINYDLKFLFNIKMKFIQILFFINLFIFYIKNLLNVLFINFIIELKDKLEENNFKKVFNNIVFLESTKKYKLINSNTTKNFYFFYLIYIYKLILVQNNKNLKNFNNFIFENTKMHKVFKKLFINNYLSNNLSNNYIYNKRFFIWYKLNKQKISKNIKYKKIFNKIYKIKKKLLKKTKWRFFKKFNYSLKLNEYWYLPKYYDFNFYTLKGGVLRSPIYNEVYLSSKISFKNILNNFKQNF